MISLRPYLRVSFDESGIEKSNDEQLDEIETATGHNPSWVMSTGVPYSDVGSASKFARKRREDFDMLIAVLRDNTFDDDGLIMWESSRGSRRVSEWLTLLELLEERGKVVVVITHGPRLYNPSNHRDWRTLIDEAVDSEYESRKTSTRVRRSMVSAAKAGTVPPGRRMFGYDRTGMVVDPAERVVLLDAIGKVLQGTTTRQIAKDWNADGITTTVGTIGTRPLCGRCCATRGWQRCGCITAVLSAKVCGLQSSTGRHTAGWLPYWPPCLWCRPWANHRGC